MPACDYDFSGQKGQTRTNIRVIGLKMVHTRKILLCWSALVFLPFCHIFPLVKLCEDQIKASLRKQNK